MLPIKVNPTDFKAKEILEQEKKKRTKQHSRSVQAIADMAVAMSMNPNGGPVVQQAANQPAQQ